MIKISKEEQELLKYQGVRIGTDKNGYVRRINDTVLTPKSRKEFEGILRNKGTLNFRTYDKSYKYFMGKYAEAPFLGASEKVLGHLQTFDDMYRKYDKLTKQYNKQMLKSGEPFSPMGMSKEYVRDVLIGNGSPTKLLRAIGSLHRDIERTQNRIAGYGHINYYQERLETLIGDIGTHTQYGYVLKKLGISSPENIRKLLRLKDDYEQLVQINLDEVEKWWIPLREYHDSDPDYVIQCNSPGSETMQYAKGLTLREVARNLKRALTANKSRKSVYLPDGN